MGHAIRAVVFDLDGTLLDTLADIARAMNTVLARRGFPEHPVDAYRAMVGSGLTKLAERALPSGRDRLVAECARELRDAYARAPVVETRPYEGVGDLLEALAARGYRLAVLSNKADELVRRIVPSFFADGTFAAVNGHVDGVPPKPDPTSALELVGRLGVEPVQAVLLGDSDVDMKTALNAGLDPIGAAWGFRGADELHAAGARAVIDRPIDLLATIER